MPRFPGVLDPRAADPSTRGALRAWLALQQSLAFEPAEAVAALERTPDPERALVRCRRPRPARGRVDAALAVLAELDIAALPLLSPLYPPRLRRLPDAAPLLLVRGDPRVLRGAAVAIVGARAATACGREVARSLAGELARAGLVVVSGLARGIDAAAHRGALEAGGLTVAVLACGPDQVYPPEHRDLADQIAARGAVISELPPGAPPRAVHFPWRNRLISGLARAVVVVEARVRSGSLITARHAAEQGCEVMAVPGPVTAPTSLGSNRLLRDGAWPVLDADDVLGLLGLPLRSTRRRADRAPELPPGQRAILEALHHQPSSPDELGRRLGRPPQDLAVDLLNLELAGRVRQDRDGCLRALPPPGDPEL